MEATSSTNRFDIIVIGSGMGGMTTTAVLARFKYRVLLLEQALIIGGLTHAFLSMPTSSTLHPPSLARVSAGVEFG